MINTNKTNLPNPQMRFAIMLKKEEKEIKKNIFLSFILVFIMYSMMGCATSGGNKPGEPPASFSIGNSGAEITGRIDNLNLAKTYFLDDTHLFIVGTDQKVPLMLSGDGSIIIADKDLFQASIAKDGTFTFRIQNVPEGHYEIGIQPLRSHGIVKIFSRKTGQLIDLFISNAAAESSKIDLGNVVIGKP